MATGICTVDRVHDVFTEVEFQERVCKSRKPVILCGLDLGSAPRLWNPEYLGEKCGPQPVRVHVCPVQQMDFISKNFAYKYATVGMVPPWAYRTPQDAPI